MKPNRLREDNIQMNEQLTESAWSELNRKLDRPIGIYHSYFCNTILLYFITYVHTYYTCFVKSRLISFLSFFSWLNSLPGHSRFAWAFKHGHIQSTIFNEPNIIKLHQFSSFCFGLLLEREREVLVSIF